MHSEQVFVTPALAEQWLQSNTNNRNLSRSTVAAYAKDMQMSEWKETHQGIAFDKNGNVADGQHRLQAIIKSGVSIKIMVTWGVEPEVIVGIDRGMPRSVEAALKFSGKGNYLKRDVSLANTLRNLFDRRAGKTTASATHYRIELLSDEFYFVKKQFPTLKANITTAAVMAAIVVAYQHVPEQKLIDFCRVLNTGMPDSEEDRIIIMLREFLISNSRVLHASIEGRRTCSKKVMRAIKAYAEGQKLTKLMEPAEFPYQLKNEDEFLEAEKQ